MGATQDVFILDARRTAVGSFGKSLKDVPPISLGTTAAKAALEASKVDGAEVQATVIGSVIHGEPRDMYISRVISMEAGAPKEAHALTVNRLCGSGLQAVVSATQMVTLGDAEIALAGGAESMSRSGYLVQGARWGTKMGDAKTVDMMLQALHDPFGAGHMGVTAENVAKRCQITREEQDAFALESHRRAAAAVSEGRFKEQIAPVVMETRKGEVVFEQDEHFRAEASIEDMAKLRPAFQKDGTVTAGNASGLNDGAGALVLASEREVSRRGAKPIARIVSYGLAGVEPSEMGMGPAPASRRAIDRAGLSFEDLDVIESNEAFAAQACAVTKELGLDPAKVNPNGGAIALGHPIGASGAIILTKLLYELKRTKGRYGLATMCIGGGQGIAVVVEHLH
ncbi:MAG: beta-ketothiolase BktB [Pseudomonadota bacterium]